MKEAHQSSLLMIAQECVTKLESVKTQLGKGTAYYAHEALQKVSCYATVKMTGDDRFVRDYAVQRVTEALHILRLCIPSSNDLVSRQMFRLSRVNLVYCTITNDSGRYPIIRIRYKQVIISL